MLVRQSQTSSFPLVYTLYAKLTSCSFTFTIQVHVWYQSSHQVLSKKTDLSVSNPSKYQLFHPKLHILGFLKVFHLLDLTHTKPCLTWMFSFCTFKTACISTLHPRTVVQTLSLHGIYYQHHTLHKAPAICICSITQMYTLLHQWCFLIFFSTILSNEFYQYMMIFLRWVESMHTDC